VTLSTDELDRLVLDRGWIAVDRADGYAMYDWPPSSQNANHEVTYLILDVTGCNRPPSYRVSCLDGKRAMYETAPSLVADLDLIATRLCAARRASRVPTGERMKRVIVTTAAIRAMVRKHTKASAGLEGREVPEGHVRSPAVERYITERTQQVSAAPRSRRVSQVDATNQAVESEVGDG